MSKERISASVDSEVAEYLGQDDVNASGLINKLVKNHTKTGGGREAMLELRESQLESELAEARGTVESKKEEIEKVRDELDEYAVNTEEVVAEASEQLHRVPLDPENAAIRNWAGKANLSPEEFITRLEQQRGER